MFEELAELASIHSPWPLAAFACGPCWALTWNRIQAAPSLSPGKYPWPLAPHPLGTQDWEVVLGFRRNTPSHPAHHSCPRPRYSPASHTGSNSKCSFAPWPSELSQALRSQFTFPRFYLSHWDNNMCGGMWRIGTKWAGREAPVYLHKGTYFTSFHQLQPSGCPGMMAGVGAGGGRDMQFIR